MEVFGDTGNIEALSMPSPNLLLEDMADRLLNSMRTCRMFVECNLSSGYGERFAWRHYKTSKLAAVHKYKTTHVDRSTDYDLADRTANVSLTVHSVGPPLGSRTYCTLRSRFMRVACLR